MLYDRRSKGRRPTVGGDHGSSYDIHLEYNELQRLTLIRREMRSLGGDNG